MPDPSLRSVQRWMKSRIRAAGADSPELPSGLLNPQGGAPGAERLAVYAAGYLERMRQALSDVYAAVQWVLGERAFRMLAEAYAAAHPSHDYNLTFAGRHLPEFLSGWAKTSELPFLPDLARLEWQVCQAFHAFEEPPLQVSALAGLSPQDWERTRLVFQPSISVVASAWPILDIWAARNTPRGAVEIDLRDRPQRVVVFRRETAAHGMALEVREYQLLRELLDGVTLGQACGRLRQEGRPGDAAAPPSIDSARDGALSEVEGPPLAEWFSAWAAAGWIVRCETA